MTRGGVKEPVNTGCVPMPGDPRLAFYVDALRLLEATAVPFLVGGAFAHSRYTGRERDTKDLDVMLRQEDVRSRARRLRERGLSG